MLLNNSNLLKYLLEAFFDLPPSFGKEKYINESLFNMTHITIPSRKISRHVFDIKKMMQRKINKKKSYYFDDDMEVIMKQVFVLRKRVIVQDTSLLIYYNVI